ncbi:glycosyltransferase [Chryseobacterium suipulveris]|uniref:Glycosyltransferase n=1 Tax=Chryseobacterium suipulveris TaxID=2929800 RepID=A0ABY4BQQ5_9FLAO|nr:glycosyltransferase [Chryseobacterium suipulveris]UOE41526.1 glycosyltransferase [Chryseobacterium suipulveris]
MEKSVYFKELDCMKIIRLSTFLDFGGIESKMVNLSTYTDDENEWVFVAIGKGGVAEKKILSNGKKVITLGLNHRIPSVRTLRELYKFLKSEKPDVVHSSGAEANFFGFIAGKMAGIKNIVVEEIGIPTHSNKARKIFQYIFKYADWVVGESKIVTQNLIQNYGVYPSKAKVIHNFGIFQPLPSYEKESGSSGVFKLVMISRLEPVKNIDGVLNVLAKLVKGTKDIHLTIAGTGTSESNLKAKVKSLHLEDYVDFVGFIHDPYPYLLNSDLYVLNSFSEGFSNSLVEAMYSKTPSLSTEVGAASEMIKDGKNGFLVSVNDENALYDKIINIMNLTKTERLEIGKKGNATVVQNFSLEKHIQNLMTIYAEK